MILCNSKRQINRLLAYLSDLHQANNNLIKENTYLHIFTNNLQSSALLLIHSNTIHTYKYLCIQNIEDNIIDKHAYDIFITAFNKNIAIIELFMQIYRHIYNYTWCILTYKILYLLIYYTQIITNIYSSAIRKNK